jgi:hypothetical protein
MDPFDMFDMAMDLAFALDEVADFGTADASSPTDAKEEESN